MMIIKNVLHWLTDRNCAATLHTIVKKEKKRHQNVLCTMWQVLWSQDDPETITIPVTVEYVV